ncbi:Ubiquitin carboxyl-terminal hydrolase 6 (Deubiquitinating enzyme 6) (Proto-oncogene TRE-2) (Ubiquitin thioesterase 6) (Ubiquitin-specific-processing protease 6) [Durusdinium trenchii]|uniref:Ubiquitin carboxyl-terminal hydrolase 6 (Deubiquitinating enzyme 6) (Proto-oncogene TRE-2) (Ubiquitin thioesterase 6) (Ubiquitin-specific-processing protease 6) n=1 Tax=Durusdinium trenchii TaxID=1381693 RepID=A0ABP0HFV0_9DINO
MDEFLEGKAESPKGGEWFGDRFGVVRVEDEGNGWDAGAFLLETMKDGEWPRDRDTEAGPLVEDAPTEEAPRCLHRAGIDLGSTFQERPSLVSRALKWEIGLRPRPLGPVNGCREARLRPSSVGDRRGTIVDVVLRQTSTSSTPSQVKVHFDSTVYKSDEWINTQRLALLGRPKGPGIGVARDAWGPSSSDRRGRTGKTRKNGGGLEKNFGKWAEESGRLPASLVLQAMRMSPTPRFSGSTFRVVGSRPFEKREYFLCSQHLAESKERARSSSLKGKFAQEFGSVLLELWSGKGSVVSPNNLKRTIDQFAPQFAGYEQHDAQVKGRESLAGDPS